MSYLALARKWRPGQFSEVVGQSHVLTALENALSQNRLHHAYLFSGTRGVGKTTIGRLFAKGLNCETGITSRPCGRCTACQEIGQGRFVDLLEIDAASRTRVEDTRELLDNVQYKPARGRFKVYLIDEVHMLSRHSFNALLKTLEEPPEYVKFLLATTDPQKLPVTILSRCLQFHLKPIGIDDIEQQLAYILQQEQIESHPRALGLIAHAADGSMRDALSLTDQAIALGNGQIDPDIVAHMLGTIDTDQALNLIRALSHKEAQQVIDNVAYLAANGVAWDALLQSLAEQLYRISMYQMLPASLDPARPDAAMIQHLAQILTPEDVQLFYQIALKGREDLPLAPTARIGLEMTLLRMIAFRPADVSPVHSVDTQVSQAPAISPPHASVAPSPSENTVSATPPSAAALDASPEPLVNNRPDLSVEPPSADMAPVNWPESVESVPDAVSAEVPESQQTLVSDERSHPDAQENNDTGEVVRTDGVSPSRNPLIGLRHQLRSQRIANQSGHKDKPKKSEATPTAPATKPERESLIDRFNQRKMISSVSPETLTPAVGKDADAASTTPNEAYQWRPTGAFQPQEKEKYLTPAELKKALTHEKTPEMAARLVREVIETDEWASMISQLSIPKLVEQLALNSFYQRQGDTIQLTLRENQAHLNTEKARATLNEALNHLTGVSCQLLIDIGESGTTPLEKREALYQEKLEQALNSLNADPNIRWIEERFQAQLDKSSVRPV